MLLKRHSRDACEDESGTSMMAQRSLRGLGMGLRFQTDESWVLMSWVEDDWRKRECIAVMTRLCFFHNIVVAI